jgi:uncharacterized membrane-anchored protein YitT (DUF2179 family)
VWIFCNLADQALFMKVRRLDFKNIDYKNAFKDLFLVTCGILSAGLGLKGFLLPNDFIDGGVTGISLLVSQLSGISLPVLIFIINIPFIFLGYTQVTKMFAVKTFLAIIGLALCLVFIEFPIVTSDKLLISVFGGFFLGLGIGLCVRGGCVIDGTEVLALYVSRKTSLTIGDVILIINIIIFSIAAMLLGIEVALYSMLTYLSASKTIDFIVQGIEEYIGVTIISEKSEKIRQIIVVKLGRGVTIYKGKRGFVRKESHDNDMDIIFTVVTRLEVAKLKSEIDKVDEKAFVIQHSINDTKGGMIKKRPLH